MNNKELIERLKRKGIEIGEPIRIAPSSEDLKRHEDINKYIKDIEEAHRRTKYSTLRFDYRFVS